MRYIGSKINLLENIENIINQISFAKNKEVTFLDLFAGTNTVGKHFKKDYTIYSNDLLYFSYLNAKATIETNKPLQFEKLKEKGILSPLDYLQENADIAAKNNKSIGYYEQSYTPTGEAMYFSIENGKRIDYIRDKIEEWWQEKNLTEYEYAYLTAVLIDAVPYISNITGTYGAFLKHWDKRALNPLTLQPLQILNNQKENKSYHLDANDLVKKISVDIAYIDTPYNNRQYASNYHVLENIASHKKPVLKGKTKIFEWSHLRSDYAMKRKALDAMEDLLSNLQATHIIISYNNEGIIEESELIRIAEKYSDKDSLKIERIPYRKYKSKQPSSTYDLYELLIYITKNKKANDFTESNEEKEVPKNETNNKKSEPQQLALWSMEKKEYIKSPLNYIGGKYKLLPQLLPYFPTTIDTFVDLFSGGGNVGINVKAKKHIFNDMNYKINEMFRYFSSMKPEDLIPRIKERIIVNQLSKTNEAAFLAFRENYNLAPNPLDLYILISYSYNYQIRFNNNGKFNNPFGRNRSQFSANMEKNLYQFVAQLHELNASFTDYLFTDFPIDKLTPSDFVYLDPPYLITTGSYNDGNRGFVNWDEKQELAMYELMKELTKQGISYALSNVIEHKGKHNILLQNFIRENDVHVHYLDYHYNNASYNTKGKGSLEVLITNYNFN